VFEDVKEALIIPVIAFGGKVLWELCWKIYWYMACSVCGNNGVNSSDGVT
jgi:hypothetical protein